MGRQREETVGSYVAHGEVFSMTLQTNRQTGMRWWECSCTTVGIPWATADRSGLDLVQDWWRHLARAHPDAEVFQ